jgi:hypothetical protein
MLQGKFKWKFCKKMFSKFEFKVFVFAFSKILAMPPEGNGKIKKIILEFELKFVKIWHTTGGK